MLYTISIKLDQIGWDTVSAISGVIIAILGFIINRRLRRRAKQAERYALLAEYRKEIIAYSSEFFDLVAEARSLRTRSKNDDAVKAELAGISSKLSSLADTGRFLFPNDNVGKNAFGAEKGPAFEGLRRPALDAILAAHFVVEAMSRDSDEAPSYYEKALKELRRTKQPLAVPIREQDPGYLLVQCRRCYLNVVVPGTFPREWLTMFATLLGPINAEENP